jgi:ankyrin repeat protein
MSNGCRRLVAAFFSSEDEALRLLKEEPGLIESRDGLGETPLHYLSVENQLHAVKTLVSKGGSVNTVNLCGGTPLSEAASLGYTELVSFLLSTGAKLLIEGQSELLLHAAVRSGCLETVKAILGAGAEVNEIDDLRDTPLHVAATSDKNTEIIKTLIEKVPIYEQNASSMKHHWM